jgi:hypothetical protein
MCSACRGRLGPLAGMTCATGLPLIYAGALGVGFPKPPHPHTCTHAAQITSPWASLALRGWLALLPHARRVAAPCPPPPPLLLLSSHSPARGKARESPKSACASIPCYLCVAVALAVSKALT